MEENKKDNGSENNLILVNSEGQGIKWAHNKYKYENLFDHMHNCIPISRNRRIIEMDEDIKKLECERKTKLWDIIYRLFRLIIRFP